jgi:hypothetical protein
LLNGDRDARAAGFIATGIALLAICALLSLVASPSTGCSQPD